MTTPTPEPTPTTTGSTGSTVTTTGTGTTPPPTPPVTTPPAATPGADAAEDKGFPQNTPVAQMNPEQAAAYWQHQNRKQEGRAEAYHKAAGGKTPEEIASLIADADKVRQERLTEQEKAVEAAKAEGASTASAQWKVAAVEAAFDIALSHLDDTARAEALSVLDLSKFVSESGKVDTAKVRQHAERMAPGTGGGAKTPTFDFGAGKRGGDPASTGVSAGEALYERRHPKKTTTTP